MKTSIDIQKDLANIFETYTSKTVGKSDAMNNVFEGYMHLRVVALSTLKGVFSPEEINLLVDNLNGTIIDAQFKANPSVLAAHIEDGDMYEGLGSKWGVNVAALCEKIRSLNHLQVYFLNDEILRWWDKQFCSLEEFVKIYSDTFKFSKEQATRVFRYDTYVGSSGVLKGFALSKSKALEELRCIENYTEEISASQLSKSIDSNEKYGQITEFETSEEVTEQMLKDETRMLKIWGESDIIDEYYFW